MCHVDMISISWPKTKVTPLLMLWIYRSLALSHPYETTDTGKKKSCTYIFPDVDTVDGLVLLGTKHLPLHLCFLKENTQYQMSSTAGAVTLRTKQSTVVITQLNMVQYNILINMPEYARTRQVIVPILAASIPILAHYGTFLWDDIAYSITTATAEYW